MISCFLHADVSQIYISSTELSWTPESHNQLFKLCVWQASQNQHVHKWTLDLSLRFLPSHSSTSFYQLLETIQSINQQNPKIPNKQIWTLITPLFLSYPISNLSCHSDLLKYVTHIMSFPRTLQWLPISLKIKENNHYNVLHISKWHKTILY